MPLRFHSNARIRKSRISRSNHRKWNSCHPRSLPSPMTTTRSSHSSRDKKIVFDQRRIFQKIVVQMENSKYPGNYTLRRKQSNRIPKRLLRKGIRQEEVQVRMYLEKWESKNEEEGVTWDPRGFTEGVTNFHFLSLWEQIPPLLFF